MTTHKRTMHKAAARRKGSQKCQASQDAAGVITDKHRESPIFLGICQSALVRGDGVSLDLYGVSQILPLPFFPQTLAGVYLVIALPCASMRGQSTISIFLHDRERPSQAAASNLTIELREPVGDRIQLSGAAQPFVEREGIKPRDSQSEMSAPRLLPPLCSARYKLLPVPCPPLFVVEPTEIIVTVDDMGQRKRIGGFLCVFVKPAPMSEEEQAAIKSRPGAVGGITYEISCKKCGDKLQIGLSLDPTSVPAHGPVQLDRAPDMWKCRCAETVCPLTYLKQGFHEMLRRIALSDEGRQAKCVPLYQPGALSAILRKYQQVLAECDHDEEAVFRFMAKNPILWNFLTPMKIWKKPPILSAYKADFAILTRSNVLWFIEIEKPSTKLIKGRGGISSELQAGLDQIRDWRSQVSERREAVLAGLGLSQNQVHDVRFTLIAGMAANTSPTGLARVRAMKSDADMLLCFDELASFLHSLEATLMTI